MDKSTIRCLKSSQGIEYHVAHTNEKNRWQRRNAALSFICTACFPGVVKGPAHPDILAFLEKSEQ